MIMKNILLVIQIIVSLLLVAAVIVQTKGTGFGRVWGSSPSSFTRRGLEKLIFRATFVLCALFIIISIVSLLI